MLVNIPYMDRLGYVDRRHNVFFQGPPPGEVLFEFNMTCQSPIGILAKPKLRMVSWNLNDLCVSVIWTS